MTDRDPYLILCRIDTQMRYAANDPELFSELCIRREVIAGSMEAIANSVARFLQFAFKPLESLPVTEKEGFEPSFDANPRSDRAGFHSTTSAPGGESC